MSYWDTIKARSKSCFFAVYDEHYKITLFASGLLLLVLVFALLTYIDQQKGSSPPPTSTSTTTTTMA